MQGDHAPAAHAYDAPRRGPGLRELEAAESFAGFGDAVRFALDIISWRLPGSDPFVTRVHGDEVSLHTGPGDDGGPAAAGPGAKGYVGMPLIGSGGRQLGSLCILDREFEGADDHAVQRMLEAMGRILISEIEREEREESLRAAAEIDPLTGLLNRRSFEFALRHEWRRARSGESDS